jgi:hydrogenase/urease accessory protein HupE
MRPNFVVITALFLLFVTGFSTNVTAHESQPGFLQLTQQDASHTEAVWEVLWRAPIYYGKPHPARLKLPSNWKNVKPSTTRRLSDSELHRHIVSVGAESIHGSIIRFPGLEATTTNVLLRVVYADGNSSTTIIKSAEPKVVITGPQSAWQVAWDYTLLGVEHILSGIDHLLFVLALLLIVKNMRTLLVTITAFTVAHSITLAAATLGWLWVPGPPVEAVIALSILFLAGELVKVNRGQQSLTANFPWLVAFTFGLLHGFGFAGALSQVGLTQNEIPLALLMFNVGVELGQLLFVVVMLMLIRALHKIQYKWPQWAHQLPAYSIGGMAAFWFVQRVSGFITV